MGTHDLAHDASATSGSPVRVWRTLARMDSGLQSQLTSIGDVVDAAREAGIQIWLRGGWAVDFVVGEVTRFHRDVDWFALADQIEVLRAALELHGWQEVAEADREQQRDFVRDGVEIGIALIRLENGEPVVAGGPFAGEPWPRTMIEGSRSLTLLGVEAQVIEPLAQIEIKRMMPTWNPQLVRRAKDLVDIQRLELKLGGNDRTRPPVFCLCGSTRFRDEMTDANRRLTLAGAIVVAPAVFQHAGDTITDSQKEHLDNLHLRKIDLADAVFVVDPGGYIGDSTRREIAYGRTHGKPVFRLSALDVSMDDLVARPGGSAAQDLQETLINARPAGG